MKPKNNYEIAFSLWLDEHNYSYRSVKQTDRLRVGELSVKSFDYVIERENRLYIVELKGRIFKGHSFYKLSGLQNWVTADDVSSLAGWQSVQGVSGAVLVFAYLIEDYYADLDNNDSIESDGVKYVFVAIDISEYQKYMKLRSPKWNTVDIAADNFRICVKKVSEFFKI